MSDPIDNATHFKELRSDVREGFTGINARIDTLVTRNEFNAELRRIDEKHERLSDSTEKGFMNRDESINKIIVSNRWGLGFAVTIVGVIITVVNLLVK